MGLDLGASEARAALYAAAASGARTIFFVGHGSADRWAGEAVPAIGDAPRFAAGRPTAAVALSCLNVAFGGGDCESVGEAMLRAPDAGAWAVVGSVGFADEGVQSVLGIGLAHELARGLAWGDAVLAAKRALPAGATSVHRTFILLGDPASGGPEESGLRLISPRGGEVFGSGETIRLLWSTSGNIGAVVAELSLDGGGTWEPVDGSMLSPGALDWPVP